VELKHRGVALRRPVVLLSEADEEADSSGIQWLIKNAYPKINAEFAINEGGFAFDIPSGQRVFQIQTAEKIPSRVTLTARGTAGHGSLPRPDNPEVHLARAITRVADGDQPVRLNTTTRRYFQDRCCPTIAGSALSAEVENNGAAIAAANEIRSAIPSSMRSFALDVFMLTAGMKINVIPNGGSKWTSGGCLTKPARRSSRGCATSSTIRRSK
jgi:acetylornithine deacetylase/succinyl-diaminopimelate desuccinylase-like protein